jgi:class 3 adenylate cyclase
LTVTNEAPYHQTIYLERGEWYADAATADVVTTLQLFRDLFGEEVLRPHEQIAVEGMSILFSDLVGSTALYDREGDAPSYALVREQFEFLRKIIREHEGGIVKTIGDSIMAAFTDPAQGLRAALTIQESIPAFNQQQPATPLTLRLGLHFGPCIAVNLNGRLDYFGTTVNIAARLEGQSRGGDVVISDIVWRDVAVQDLLKTYPLGVERFKTAIKGFDEDFVLYRLMLDVNSPTNSGASKSTPVAMSSPK